MSSPTIQELQDFQRRADEARVAAAKLGAFIELFGRAKTVLDVAGSIAGAQLAWNDEQRTRILAEHTADAEKTAQAIRAEARADAERIVQAANNEAKVIVEDATRNAKAEVEVQRALLARLEGQRNALSAEIDGLTAQVQVLESRIESAKQTLRAAG